MLTAFAATLLLFVSVQGAPPSNMWTVNGNSLEFMALGDGGLDTAGPQGHDWGVENLKTLSSTMGNIADKEKISFVMMMGDNFYQRGIRSTTSSRWKTTFSDVFGAPSLQQLPFYACLGNHDYYGNFEPNTGAKDDKGTLAQINYTNFPGNLNKRWRMPWYYYDFTIDVVAPDKAQSFKIHMVIIDAYSLMSYGETGCHDIADGSEKPEYCNGESIPSKNVQLEWFKNTLSKSTADWLIVGGHHPVCSVGSHGIRDSVHTFEKEVRAILENFKVDAYFSGHDHLNQVFTSPKVTHELGYYSIGSAGKTDGRLHGDQAAIDNVMGEGVCKIEFAETTTGFSKHTLTKDSMKATVYDMTGKELHFHKQGNNRCLRMPNADGCHKNIRFR